MSPRAERPHLSAATVNDHTRARFEQEVLPHLTPVYNTALRLARSDPDARDLVQETMLRALRTYDGFTPRTNARAWLFTILYSVFINRYRKARRDPNVLSMDDLAERFHQEFQAPVASEVRPATAAEVERAVMALPEAFRTAVVLVDLEDLSYEEAAAVMECPVGTLRSRLFRARRLLADALRTFAPAIGGDHKDSGA